jgi:hypothetical protein
VVTGMIATYPVGGVAWDYGQYALGLERLGFEVCYVEDTGGDAYDPRLGVYQDNFAFGAGFLESSLATLSPSLATRWHLRTPTDETFGMRRPELAEFVASADLFLNVSGSSLLRDEYMSCPRKVLIDTDPGWNHFVNYPKWDASPGWLGTHGYRAHDHFFTYAERLGQPDCVLPDLGLSWHPTRPPVVLDCWQPEPPGTTWTTVMTWNNFGRPVEYKGVVYGTKEREFTRVETLPTKTDVRLELATGGSGAPREHWRALGWSVINSEDVSRSPGDYQSYVQRSRGEFSVAKNLYVATRSGWFSCRSTCYLAAGRPVVVQDTGFSEVIPTGQGLLAFSTLDEALDAIHRVEHDYPAHQAAARRLARSHFDSGVVLRGLLRSVGLE